MSKLSRLFTIVFIAQFAWFFFLLNNVEWIKSLNYISMFENVSMYNIIIIRGYILYYLIASTIKKGYYTYILYFYIGDILFNCIEITLILFILFIYKKHIEDSTLKKKVFLVFLVNIITFFLLPYIIFILNFIILQILSNTYKKNKIIKKYIISTYMFIFVLYIFMLFFLLKNDLLNYTIYFILCLRLNLRIIYTIYPTIIKKQKLILSPFIFLRKI